MKMQSILAAAAAAMLHAHAAAEGTDMAKVIGEWRTTAVSVRVVITDPGVMYVAKLTEKQMNKFGCSYTVEGDRAQEVIAILDKAGIYAAPPFFVHGPESRMGFYVKTSDGATHKLLFTGTGYMPKTQYGTYDDKTTVQTIDPNFADNVRGWALTQDPVRGTACRPESFKPAKEPRPDPNREPPAQP